MGSFARSVGAVVAGFVATAVLSVVADAGMHITGVFPEGRMADALFVLPAAYRAVFTVVGGWLTARLAPGRPLLHAGVLSVLGLAGGLGGVAVSLAHPELGPLWYAVTIPVSAVPCILGGAWVAGRGTAQPTRQ